MLNLFCMGYYCIMGFEALTELPRTGLILPMLSSYPIGAAEPKRPVCVNPNYCNWRFFGSWLCGFFCLNDYTCFYSWFWYTFVNGEIGLDGFVELFELRRTFICWGAVPGRDTFKLPLKGLFWFNSLRLPGAPPFPFYMS